MFKAFLLLRVALFIGSIPIVVTIKEISLKRLKTLKNVH